MKLTLIIFSLLLCSYSSYATEPVKKGAENSSTKGSCAVSETVLSNFSEPKKNPDESTAFACLYVGGEIGIRSENCRGIGLGCTTWETEVGFGDKPTGTGKIKICLYRKKANLLELIISPVSGKVMSNFVVEKTYGLDPRLSSSLGISSTSKLVPGSYPMKKTSDGNYSTEIAVLSN